MGDKKKKYYITFLHEKGYGKCTMDINGVLGSVEDMLWLTEKIETECKVKKVAIVYLMQLGV